MAFFTLILGILPKQNATDSQKFVQIAHLSGFLAGIICVIMIFALRNWKKVFCSFFKQID
ncbi:peptidase S54, rhomboid [Lacticaseibacillus rhamnosus MTCC 5462]|nr:peptidase S54, rhomboid [Lacticaseibacillus rhamnosus MTCC 5462]